MIIDLERAAKWVDIAIKAELHAIVLLFTGAGLLHAGHQVEGGGLIMGALAIFKGKGVSN